MWIKPVEKQVECSITHQAANNTSKDVEQSHNIWAALSAQQGGILIEDWLDWVAKLANISYELADVVISCPQSCQYPKKLS